MAAAEKGGEGGAIGAELWQKSHIQRGTGLSLGGVEFLRFRGSQRFLN